MAIEASEVTDVDIGAIVANVDDAATAAETADTGRLAPDDAVANMLASNACWTACCCCCAVDSGSVCCNKSV